MRLAIIFAITVSGIVPVSLQLSSDQRHSALWQSNSVSIANRPKLQATVSLSSGIQRRSPGNNKNRKSRSKHDKASQPNLQPDWTSGTPVTQNQISSIPSTTPKSQEKHNAKVKQFPSKAGKQSPDTQSKQQRQRQQKNEPITPSKSTVSKMRDSTDQPAKAVHAGERNPPPSYRFSKPGVDGEGSRQGQGGAQTPGDRSPSPTRPKFPVRLTFSPPGSHSSSEYSPSSSRSSSPLESRPLIGPSSSTSRSKTSSQSKSSSRGRSGGPSSSMPRLPSPLGNERGRTTLSPKLASLLFHAGSPSIPAEWKDDRPPGEDKFKNWLGSMKSMTEALKEIPPSPRAANPDDIREVHLTKGIARQARALADSSRATATRISETRNALSPQTERAVRKSDRDAMTAVAATRAHTAALTAAVFSTHGTSQHDRAIPYWESAARQWMRAQTLETHRSASAAEYNARVMKQAALSLPNDDPDRGNAYMRAAAAKKLACRDAGQYYRCRREYEATKAEFPGGDSSSDEERPLRDTPRPAEPGWRNTPTGERSDILTLPDSVLPRNG